jgi:hypothetical protein
MSSFFMFMGAWGAVSVVTAFATARAMGFCARNDTREPEALAAYARRPQRLVLVRDPRSQRRA